MPTVEEIKIYEKVKKYFCKEDIKSRAEKDFTEEELEQMCEDIERGLDNHDTYWACYWEAVEYCIKEYTKE